ncbi:MAG: acyltransferase family protein [Aquabacterium sp.]
MSPASAHLSHPKYRPDIDGLRAVAVLAVVAFHAFPDAIRGGFIGVDVFFVISGYLISTIIFDNLARGTFSFAEFYGRRVRRIFPALTLVLLACLVLGWHTLLVDEYGKLGKHVAGGAGFISNFVLWGESGYFDDVADTKPLLHLWSLGVEEQFYIVWPLLLWLARKKKATLLMATALLAAVSFTLNVKGVKADAVATFYAPQTRFWELLCGGLLAWLTLYGRVGATLKGAWSHVASAAGLLILTYGFARISRTLSFPGKWALMPVFGAVLIIAAGSRAWVNRVILSNRVAVWFGLISFPLYLWHWPLLSFARIVEGGTPSVGIRAGAVALAIVLAWLTYAFIEHPMRSGVRNAMKTGALMAGMTVLGLVGFYAFHEHGLLFKGALGRDYLALTNYDYFSGKSQEAFWEGGCFNLHEDASMFQRNRCESQAFQGRPKVFLVGDSHSAYLSQYLRPYLEGMQDNLFQYSTAYCTPFSLMDKRARCRGINAYMLQRIAQEHPDFVILSAHYMSWADGPDYGESASYEAFLREQTLRLRQMGVKQVLILGQMPIWEDKLPHVLLKHFVDKRRPIPPRTREGVVPAALAWDDKLAQVDWPQGVHYLSMRQLLCNEAGCLTLIGPDIQTDLVVFDSGHLSKSGARFITERLLAPFLAGGH